MLAVRGWSSSPNSRRAWRPRWLRKERPKTRRSSAWGAEGGRRSGLNLVPRQPGSVLTPAACRCSRKQTSCPRVWETDTTQNGNKETSDHEDKKAGGREVRKGDYFETGGQGAALRSYLQART